MMSTVLSGLRTVALVPPILFLSACATTSLTNMPEAAPVKPSLLLTPYVCAGGVEISVEQTGAHSAGQPITVVYSGIRYPMHIVPSGSGGKYVNDANQLEWSGKGEEALLTHFGTGQILAMNCKATLSQSN
jgi:membrane-bound inhibitor of C-type lysozyme